MYPCTEKSTRIIDSRIYIYSVYIYIYIYILYKNIYINVPLHGKNNKDHRYNLGRRHQEDIYLFEFL